MRHCPPIVRLAVLLLPAMVSLPAAAAPPDLMVSEREMQQHLEELGIADEAANNVRAAWGRLKFDMDRLGETSEMLAAWRDTGGILMNFFPRDEGDLRDAYMRYSEIAQPSRRAYGKWEQLLPLSAVERYFAELEESAATQRNVAASIRRAHIRMRLPRQHPGAYPHVIGETVDLVALLDQLADMHPELTNGFDVAEPATQEHLTEYDKALTDLVVERFLRMIGDQAKPRPERPERPDRPELEERWVRAYGDYSAQPRFPLLQIRALNSRTAAQLAPLLSEPERQVFRRAVNRALSPFAYDSPNLRRWQTWVDRSIAAGDLDEGKRAALDELRRTIELQRKPLAQRAVTAYDASFSIESERSYWESHARTRLGEISKPERPYEAEYKHAQETLDAFDADAWERIIRILGDDRRLIQGRIQPYEDLGQTAEEVATKDARIQESMDRWQPRQFAPFLSGAEFRAVTRRMPFTDDSRKVIFEAMYSEFSHAFTQAADAHQKWAEEKLAEARAKDEADPEHAGYWYKQSFAANAQWLHQRVAIEERFEADVRLFLNDEESAIWNSEVRASRKRRILPYALHQFQPDSERYVHDLTDTLLRSELYNSANDELNNAIEAYELAFDDALKRYEREWDAAAAEFAHSVQIWRTTQDERDLAAFERSTEKTHAIRDGILDARLDHVDAIMAALNPQDQARFRDALDAADFPSLFASSPVDYLAAAFERDDPLDDAQQAAAWRLFEEYRPARDAIRSDLVAIIRRHDFSNDRKLHDEIGQRVFRLMGNLVKLSIDTCQSIRSLFTQAEIDEMAADIRLLLAPIER